MRFFLEDSVYVSRPFEAVQEHFDLVGTWFAPFATAADKEGEDFCLRIGPSCRVAREVSVTLGPSRYRGVAIVATISWRSTGLPALFPVLEGDLELRPVSAHGCRVSLFGSYVPPFGQFGGQLDRALLHRVTQSTVRSFLTWVGASLEEENIDRRLVVQGSKDSVPSAMAVTHGSA